MNNKSRIGRPRIFKTVSKMNSMAEAYFENCKSTGEHPTLTGLILSLGLSSRQSLNRYEQRKEFSDSVKRAKLHIEHEYEKALREKNAAGSIFALKNFGWTDKQSIEYQEKSLASEFSSLEKAARIAHILSKSSNKGEANEIDTENTD